MVELLLYPPIYALLTLEDNFQRFLQVLLLALQRRNLYRGKWGGVVVVVVVGGGRERVSEEECVKERESERERAASNRYQFQKKKTRHSSPI